jgi:hypothetical protein
MKGGRGEGGLVVRLPWVADCRVQQNEYLKWGKKLFSPLEFKLLSQIKGISM